MLPGDPRLDPWLRAAPGYFAADLGGESRELWYVRLSTPFSALSGKALKALEGLGVLSPVLEAGASSLARGLGLALALLALALLLAEQGPRLAIALLCLPWLLLAQVGGPASLAFSGLLAMPALARRGACLPVWEEGGWPWKADALRPLFPGLLAASYPLYGAFLLAPNLLLSFSLAALASLSLLAATRIPSFLLPPGGRKRPFVPLRIRGGRRPVLPPPRLPQVAAALLLLGLALLPLGISPGAQAGWSSVAAGLSLPLPQRSAAPAGGGSAALPGLEEYQAHLATQREFFNRPLPSPQGEAAPGGPFAKTAGPRRVPAPPDPISLERLLADQGRGLRVQVGSAGAWKGPPLAPGAVILYILPLIAAFTAAFIRGGRPVAKTRKTT